MNMKICRPGVRMEAVIDGGGESAIWSLYLVYADWEFIELKWPESWPAWVDSRFLERLGYETFTA